MKLFASKKGASGGVIGAGIAAVTLLVVSVIIGQVENNTVWSQTLSGTIGTYIEPLAILSTFAVVGMMAYKAVKR